MELIYFSPFLILSFFFFALMSLFIFAKNQRFCNCKICSAYLTSSWSKDFNNLCDWYAYLLRNSPTQTIHLHVLGNTITANPQNVEHMLKTKFLNYPKGKQFSKILGDLLGKGIFNVDGDLWIFQRKMASMELGSFSIRSYAFEVVMAEIRTRLLPVLGSFAGKSTPVDLQDVFRRFSFDNICKFSFGLDPGCLKSSMPINKFADSFDLATKLSAERAMASSPVVWRMKRLLGIGSEKKLKDAISVVNVLAEEVIRQKRKLGYEENKDLLSRFMSNIKNDCYLRDIIVSFILAGRDTMSAALSSLFLLLASHSDSVAKIRDESEQIIPITNGEELVTFEQIREMHYLHAAVYESLRLFPPVQFDSKFAGDDDVLPDGTVVKKGTRVTYHPYAMGRMEAIWGSDCKEFKPERWLNNGKFFPQNPYKYPVFQGGIRVCLGKEMAIMEMKSVALLALRHFDFKLVKDDEPQFLPGLTATVRDGVMVMVKYRWNIAP